MRDETQPGPCSNEIALFQRFLETRNRQGQKANGQAGHGTQGHPQNADAHPLDHDAMHDLQEPAHGIEHGKPLDEFRHVADGKDESAEQNGRYEDEERREQCLLLGSGGDADQQRQSQIAENVDHGCQVEQHNAALDVDAENQACDDEHQGHGQDAGHQKRQGLADDEFRPPDGRDHYLLDGADLLFTHDGHGGEHQADEDQHDGDQAGNVIEFAFQIGIVPCPHVQPQGLAGEIDRPCAWAGSSLIEVRDGLVGVIKGDGRVVAQGAVDQKLDGNGLPGAQVGGEVLRDANHGAYLAGVEQAPDAPVTVQAVCHGKVATAGERGHQLTAHRRVVRIDHGGGDIPDVRGQGKGQYGHLHQGHHQHHHAHAHVAEHLQDFLDQDLADSQDHSFSFIRLWQSNTISAA
ncbi:hypothetical protein DESC_830084 [Desulfosarcina cetonica]|nr:hypothetical protein DESC_830084 [Desulfosarcina cetonica]